MLESVPLFVLVVCKTVAVFVSTPKTILSTVVNAANDVRQVKFALMEHAARPVGVDRFSVGAFVLINKTTGCTVAGATIPAQRGNFALVVPVNLPVVQGKLNAVGFVWIG